MLNLVSDGAARQRKSASDRILLPARPLALNWQECAEVCLERTFMKSASLQLPSLSRWSFGFMPHGWVQTEFPPDVRFGSKADICAAKRHVRFAPNSDRKADSRKWSCLLYTREQTYAVQHSMSALGQKRTSANKAQRPPCNGLAEI